MRKHLLPRRFCICPYNSQPFLNELENNVSSLVSTAVGNGDYVGDHVRIPLLFDDAVVRLCRLIFAVRQIIQF